MLVDSTRWRFSCQNKEKILYSHVQMEQLCWLGKVEKSESPSLLNIFPIQEKAHFDDSHEEADAHDQACQQLDLTDDLEGRDDFWVYFWELHLSSSRSKKGHPLRAERRIIPITTQIRWCCQANSHDIGCIAGKSNR